MKIHIVILCVLAVSLVCLAACGDNAEQNETTAKAETSQVESAIEHTTKFEKPDSLFDDYKYRAIYYSVYAPFVEIVGKDKYYDWLYSEYETVDFSERNEMAIVAFIKKFNISREDFDRANEKSIDIFMEYGGITVMNPAEEDPYYDRDIECREIYNADIIYTFDNELINSYYLYVDPYEGQLPSGQNQ